MLFLNRHRHRGRDSCPSTSCGDGRFVLCRFWEYWGGEGATAYARLRKRRRSRAYKTLGLGVGLTAVLLALQLVAVDPDIVGFFTTETPSVYTPEQIKAMALTIPYDSLRHDAGTHEGKIVHYEGTVSLVSKKLFTDKHVMWVKITPDILSRDRLWLNYQPASDEDARWLNWLRIEDVATERVDHYDIRFWGTYKGTRDHTQSLINTVTIPEIDVLILERIAPGGTGRSDAADPLQGQEPAVVDPEPVAPAGTLPGW